MAYPKSQNGVFENNDGFNDCPITSLPLAVPWQLMSQAHVDVLPFWYRPDQFQPMPRRQHGLKNRPLGSYRSDAVKHRRTRNGCFTCRYRRVKCDETRPTCDRCRKGSRQCEFPPPSKPSKRKFKSETDQPLSCMTVVTSEEEGGEESEDECSKVLGKAQNQGKQDHKPPNSAAPEPTLEDHNGQSSHHQSTQALKRSLSINRAAATSSASSTEGRESTSASVTPSPSARGATIPSSSTISAPERDDRTLRWAHLSPDLQQHLRYQRDTMTYHHYFLKHDNNDFLRTDFIDLALENEPLLYAVVAFAAYHHALARPDGKLSNFLGYYSKAVSGLRSILGDDQHPTPATLLTMLQLATFEEYLGDWVHLNGHHRAAHQLLVELYNPQTILESEIGRGIFAWYSRLEVVSALLGGGPTALSREWYIEFQAYYEDQIDPDDVDVENSVAAAFADALRVGMDAATLFSHLSQGPLGIEKVIEESDGLLQEILHLRKRIERLNDDYYTVQEYPNRQALTSDDIVDPYKAGGLFRDAFWPLNHLWIDWYGVYQMYILTMTTIRQQPLPPGMESLSLDSCRLFEAIERWPLSPRGSLLGCYQSLTLAAVFLKKDDRHIMWCRRKLATIERQGYMCAPTFRRRLAEMWNLPDVNHQWLPDDQSYSPLLHDIRAFTEMRTSTLTDQSSERLRDMSAVFSGLSV